MKLLRFCDWLINFSFSTLFFLVPLILTPFNYELFEYNKMMLVYGLTIIITGSWLIKMVVQKRIIFQRTPFDLPLLLFLLSQVVSTFFSMDRHVSLFGYYSRFNGGLFSVFSYLLLYYALVTNIKLDKLVRLIKLGLLSGIVVSLYGILERFGIDKNLWVQDVQNRVFSTLGQPNWLGAYLDIIIPLALGFFLREVGCEKWEAGNRSGKQEVGKISFQKISFQYLASHFQLLISVILLSVFYLCLLYTKSRSGLMGFGIAFLVFWVLSFCHSRSNRESRPVSKTLDPRFRGDDITRPFLILSTCYFLLSVFVGTPWTPSLQSLVQPPTSHVSLPATGPALETGGTESGEIRKIVWQGALDIARHYPLFGTGPETFAFSYYQFRPVTHNLVSEWDFLYNKAHNEYLNYAATTGFIGLGAYLLFIGWFMIWSFKKIWEVRNGKLETEVGSGKLDGKSRIQNISLQYPTSHITLLISLLAAWLSILITNFFGFSVVIISVYFWLIPAFCVILNECHSERSEESRDPSLTLRMTGIQYLAFTVILLSTFYLLLSTIRFWYADVRFNRGYQLSRAGYYQQAYQPFHEAIDINPEEPLYRDELSFTDAMLSVAASQLKESSLSALLAKEAVAQNQKALDISPQNVNFWKTKTKVYYTLSFDQKALESLQMAKTLAPTDPKITYNIALLYSRLGKNKDAIKTLEEAISLKPNYQDAHYALALFYQEAGKKPEAIKQLEYILKNISPTDKQIQEKLKEWQP